jgi:type I restriction enzyme M protein
VDHDLFNHDGLTEDGIAEAFIQFAKKENLSFFDLSPLSKGGAFDPVKYQQLMDRLEAVELTLSEVLSENDVFRIDNDFFQKEFILISKKFKNNHRLEEYTQAIICGPFGSTIQDDTYQETGVIVVRPFNLVNFKVENTNLVYISESDIVEKRLKLFHKGALLFSRVGDVRCGVLTQNEVTISPNIIATELKGENYSSYFLSVFFNSKYGLLQIMRSVKTVAQPTISTDTVRNLKLPEISKQFQNECERLLLSAFEMEIKSCNLYQKAEDLLLTELGLKDWKPTEESIAVKSFSESFLSSGRLDAEYYQPKYDQLYQSLKTATLRNGWQLKKLSELSSLFKYGVSDSLEYIEEGVPFLRIADLNKHRFSQENLKFISNESAKKYKETVRQGDVIISRSGTLGIAVVIPEFLTNAVYGSYFILTRPKKELVLPTYLALYLNSLAGKMQTEQSNTGGIQTNLTIPVLESLVIACPSLESQQKFVNKVHDSYNAEEKSKQLLEVAKIGVEKAIETDEETATAWINQQLESLGVKLI